MHPLVASDLDSLEAFLIAHFTALAASKCSAGADNLVFAIEHGIDPEEIHPLGRQLSNEITRLGTLNDRHWLCWVVHATEIGYGFTGYEFWQTFAERKPRWDVHSHPKILRSWFNRFATQFKGVQPSGRWSTHFPYISWPITHALLPKDMQMRLARAMYDARYPMAREMVRTPEVLGCLIEKQDDQSSSRFTLFLKNHELVGRIALSLLGSDFGQSAAIHQQTLERISADLSTTALAAEWMTETQRVLNPVFGKLVGAARTSRPRGQVENDVAQLHERELSPATLLLRRFGSASWSVYLAPPSLLPLCSDNMVLRSQFERTDFVSPCNGERSFKGSTLLQAQPRELELMRWPASRELLLVPKTPLPSQAPVLAADLRFDAAETWAFMLDQSGVATMVRSRQLRASQKYVLAARESCHLEGLGTAVRSACVGVTLAEIDLPATVPEALQAKLERLNFQVRRSLSIRPIGLHPRRWMDDGFSEWLTTERPCFSIARDHEFDSLHVSIDDGETIQSTWSPTDTIHLQISRLSPGMHTIRIATFKSSVKRSVSLQSQQAVCQLSLFVRVPSTWAPASTCHQHLVVDVTPSEPSVDDLAAGDLNISIAGGMGRMLRCQLQLLDSAGREISSSTIMEEPLPLKKVTWSDRLESFLKGCSDVEFGNACGGRILLNCDDLGSMVLPLSTRSEPLRWHIQTRAPQQLGLINDGIDVEEIVVARHSFEKPLLDDDLDLGQCMRGMDLEPLSGLFKVTHAGHTQSIVIKVARNLSLLSELRAPIEESSIRTIRDLATLKRRHVDWSSARAPNFLSRSWRDQVLKAIESQFTLVVFGKAWWNAENAFLSSTSRANWERLEDCVRIANLGITLGRKTGHVFHSETDLLRILQEVATAFRCNGDHDRAWSIAKGLRHVETEQLPTASELSDSKFVALVQGARLLLVGNQHPRT